MCVFCAYSLALPLSLPRALNCYCCCCCCCIHIYMLLLYVELHPDLCAIWPHHNALFICRNATVVAHTHIWNCLIFICTLVKMFIIIRRNAPAFNIFSIAFFPNYIYYEIEMEKKNHRCGKHTRSNKNHFAFRTLLHATQNQTIYTYLKSSADAFIYSSHFISRW